MSKPYIAGERIEAGDPVVFGPDGRLYVCRPSDPAVTVATGYMPTTPAGESAAAKWPVRCEGCGAVTADPRVIGTTHTEGLEGPCGGRWVAQSRGERGT